MVLLSALALAAVIAVIARRDRGATVAHSGSAAPAGPAPTATVAPPPAAAAALAPDPASCPVRFEEGAAAAGLVFKHTAGRSEHFWLPEIMGAGVALFDADGDGLEDVVLVDGTGWPAARSQGHSPGAADARTRLFRALPGGRFEDVTAKSGLDLRAQGYAALAFDVDGDGDRDLFVSTLTGLHLFVNDGHGRFREETAERGAGVGGWTTGLAPLDIDDDGDLDLFVGRYVSWSPEADDAMGCTLDGQRRAYCLPALFPPATPALLRNDGHGHFTDVSAAAGIPTAGSRVLGVLTVDLDGDRRLDLVVANDTMRNQVFLNRGDGTLAESAVPMGFAATEGGSPYAGMGVAASFQLAGQKPDEDPLCVAIANFAGEPITVHCRATSPAATGPRPFLNREAALGVRQPTVTWVKFGLLFLDPDLDGRADLFVVSGDVSDQESTVGRPMRQPMQLLWSSGARLVDASAPALGPPAGRSIVGRAAAAFDPDGDGDEDLVVTENDGPARLLWNRSERRGHAVRLRLVGAAPNRDAIGAHVEVSAGARRVRTWVHATGSYFAQSSLERVVGVGDAAGPVDVTVHWPDGRLQRFAGLAVDQAHRLVEDMGAEVAPRPAAQPVAPSARVRAMAARDKGDLPAEIAALEEAVMESPYEPELYRELAWANFRAGQQQRALDAAALAAEHAGDSTAVVNRVCIEFEKRNAIPLAQAAAERALKTIPDANGRLWASAGMYREAAGDLAGADLAFRRGIDLLPDDPEVAQNRARFLNRRGRFAEAVGLLEPFLARRMGGDAGFHDDLGVAYRGVGRRADAEREFLRAIERVEDDRTLDSRLRARTGELARMHLAELRGAPR